MSGSGTTTEVGVTGGDGQREKSPTAAEELAFITAKADALELKEETEETDALDSDVPSRPTSAPPVLDVNSAPIVANPPKTDFTRIFLDQANQEQANAFGFNYSSGAQQMAQQPVAQVAAPILWSPLNQSGDDYIMGEPILPDLSSETDFNFTLDDEGRQTPEMQQRMMQQAALDPTYMRHIWNQPEQQKAATAMQQQMSMASNVRYGVPGLTEPAGAFQAPGMMYGMDAYAGMPMAQQQTAVPPMAQAGRFGVNPYAAYATGAPYGGNVQFSLPATGQMDSSMSGRSMQTGGQQDRPQERQRMTHHRAISAGASLMSPRSSKRQKQANDFQGVSTLQPLGAIGMQKTTLEQEREQQAMEQIRMQQAQREQQQQMQQMQMAYSGAMGNQQMRGMPMMRGMAGQYGAGMVPAPAQRLPQSMRMDRHMTQPVGHPGAHQMDHSGGRQAYAPSPAPCRYFASGYCVRGDRCNFSHALDVKGDARHRSGNQNRVQSGKRANGRSNGPHPPPGKKQTIDFARYSSIEQVVGQVYRMCKDQHGCRFLQKKLEEKNPRVVAIVFDEVYDHMVELMTDPFGNYLCQKLLEHCSEQQQLLIVQKVAGHLVSISKNMHGTRAVQKMIECLCTPPQVQLVVNALRSHVVELIQDLNGNHVIQRCLNRLSIADKQFVYDSVSMNCVAVATHRHGCCVMQRCIDFASEDQKLQLIMQIAADVLTLVKDPFGNYVVQYVLDLPFRAVTAQLIINFSGHLAQLSTQKFSSNVIEKCLRVANEEVRALMVEELMGQQALQKLLQDPYGNYVIQTALTVAEVGQKARLINHIRPHLAGLRNTPYGKRIQNKILKDGG